MWLVRLDYYSVNRDFLEHVGKKGGEIDPFRTISKVLRCKRTFRTISKVSNGNRSRKRPKKNREYLKSYLPELKIKGVRCF